MHALKQALKFSILPKKAYLRHSATRKYRRAYKSHEAEIHLLPFLVDKRKAAIDIGANNGLYTYYLSKLCTRVYGFEPHKQLADFLKKATDDHVTIFNLALSDHEGEETFYTPVVRGRRSLNVASLERATIDHYHKDFVQEKVTVVPLDSYGFDDIGFIKIDVEGHELAVMRGGVETLKRCRPVILMEILTDGANVRETAVARFLLALGYAMLYVDPERTMIGIVPQAGAAGNGRNYIFLPAGDPAGA